MTETELISAGSDMLGRAKRLAEKMARVLRDETAADASVALALLASGVVEFYAEDMDHAQNMLAAIRGLEDRFVNAVMGNAKAMLN